MNQTSLKPGRQLPAGPSWVAPQLVTSCVPLPRTSGEAQALLAGTPMLAAMVMVPVPVLPAKPPMRMR